MSERVKRYDHLLTRVEYPRERGYRMEAIRLPKWIHIRITDTEHHKYLTVHSRIHVNKEVRVGPSYSLAFTDHEIIKELSSDISYRFL